MSVFIPAEPPQQPFQCSVCLRRFTRHENLKRHATLHSRRSGDASLACGLCQATFSRPDLRQRHMKRRHPEQAQRRKVSSVISIRQSPSSSPGTNAAENYPRSNGKALDPGNDIWRSVWHHEQCQIVHGHDVAPDVGGLDHSSSLRAELPQSYDLAVSLADSSGFPAHNSLKLPSLEENMTYFLDKRDFDTARDLFTPSPGGCAFDPNSPSMSSVDDSRVNDWVPCPSQVQHGCELFFTHVSHFVPFLHRPTFIPSHTPMALILSIMSLGFQYGDDNKALEQPGSGDILSIKCFRRSRQLLKSLEVSEDITENLANVQASFLLQTYAMFYLCGKESTHGLKKHSELISLARASGLMQSNAPAETSMGDLESLWKEFVKSESQKRTIFAVHQIDALWYQIFSIPRSVSHLEIKHDLPCPEDCWLAGSAAEWAHRQLVLRHSGTALKYGDAVRRLLVADVDVHSIPAFNPYGAINIAQFLISSAREVSGWSTMSGMLCLERFGPLQTSLVNLGPLIRAGQDAKHAGLCEATWQIAMIEIQLWSASHTGGIIQGSLDAVLSQATLLVSSGEFLCETGLAETIQPHVDWFLRSLDENMTPELEAPWVALYAYKAFLIAWQLVRGSIAAAMQVVGIGKGDEEGALKWARNVFSRRDRWRYGRLMTECIDKLREEK